jgi:hypothetical protein
MAGGGSLHSCLLDNTQTVKCTGKDYYGVLGNGAGESNSLNFTAVSVLDQASTISVGFIGVLNSLIFYYCPIFFTPFSLSSTLLASF